MKHHVVGNDNYQIEKIENKVLIYSKDGLPVNLEETETTVTIALYGFIKTVEKEWLYWLSFYKLEMLPQHRQYIDRYEFRDNLQVRNSKRDIKIVIFKEPIYVDKAKSFRLVARYPMYAISFGGTLLNIKQATFNKPKITRVDNKDYLYSNITDQSGIMTNRPATHRIVALTWTDPITEIDFMKTPIVDHGDGNKTNCHYTNLKWVSYSDNNKNAVKIGLRKDAIAFESRNLQTGHIEKHHSMTEMVNYFGRSRITETKDTFRPDKIWTGKAGKFEVRKTDDKRDWYYEKNEIRSDASRIKILINNKYYYDVMSIVNELLNINSRMSLDNALKKVKEKYPTYDVKVILYAVSEGYQAKDLKTGKVYISKSAKALSEMINASKSTVIKYGNLDSVYGDYHIRRSSNDSWKDLREKSVSTNHPMTITVVDVNTGDETNYDSLRKASEALNVDKKTIRLVKENNELLFGKFNIK